MSTPREIVNLSQCMNLASWSKAFAKANSKKTNEVDFILSLVQINNSSVLLVSKTLF